MVSDAPPAAPRWHVHAILAIVQLAAASGAVEGKLAMAPRAQGGEGVAPLAMTHARMIGTAVLLWALVATGRSRTKVSPLPGDHARVFGLAVLGIAVNQSLFIAGLSRTSSSTAALLAATIPVMTGVIAWLVAGARPKAGTWLGFVIAFVGVAILVGLDGVASARLDVGALLIVANCACYSAFLVLGRGVMARRGALRVTAEAFSWGALLLAPFALSALRAEVAVWSPRAWMLVLYMVLFPTALTYALNAWALKRAEATTVTAWIYAQPLLAAACAWLQLGVLPPGRFFVALPFVFLGLGLALFSDRRVATGARGQNSGSP